MESSRIARFFLRLSPGEPYHLAWGRDSKAKTGDLRPVSGSESRLGDVDVVIDSEVIRRKTQGT